MNTEDIAFIAALLGGLFVTFTSFAAFFSWCEGGWQKVWGTLQIAGIFALLMIVVCGLGLGAAFLIFNLIA